MENQFSPFPLQSIMPFYLVIIGKPETHTPKPNQKLIFHKTSEIMEGEGCEELDRRDLETFKWGIDSPINALILSLPESNTSIGFI